MLPAGRDGCHPGLDRARDHHADRHLPVVRPVGAVRAAAARVEADLADDPLAQAALERGHVHPGRFLAPDYGVGQRDRSHRTPPCAQPLSCWILSLNRVVAIAALCGWPFRKALANFFAWSYCTLPGSGGSFGSTSMSTRAGPSKASASLRAPRTFLGSRTLAPNPPQALAQAAKSATGAGNRTPCSG